MTDPHDPSLPRASSDLGGPPGTGPRVTPPPAPGLAGAGVPAEREPLATPAGAAAASGGPVTGSSVGTPAPGFDDRGHVRSTKASGVWIGLIATALFVILLIIFVAQNSRRVSIHFFGWNGQFSLALTILLAAVLGMLLVAIPGSLRIAQLRRALRKNVPGGLR
ncbi:LapA family protein [Jatrophihabitans sp.]|uniref:LapA family protein n=1 Tax=Jatrophihabitans sp. TaxID=1932789 RepID=UPI002C1ECA7B|nr:lipopolysaccharide assembly protein LapA domain-containing protein [Jatrophihabitans sp.]